MLILWGFTNFSGGGSQKNIKYGELPKKGLGQFAEGLAKNKAEGVYEGEGERVDTSMRTMT